MTSTLALSCPLGNCFSSFKFACELSDEICEWGRYKEKRLRSREISFLQCLKHRPFWKSQGEERKIGCSWGTQNSLPQRVYWRAYLDQSIFYWNVMKSSFNKMFLPSRANICLIYFNIGFFFVQEYLNVPKTKPGLLPKGLRMLIQTSPQITESTPWFSLDKKKADLSSSVPHRCSDQTINYTFK